ncbi:HypC/HybG/HupF family hydrogenase formation chaperone [Anaerocolumna sp. AGMB13025]|uniref:HypC/HybG/HupF family hydrogenase formation chaperone n=1 Tax=Anaerocolumna sp. AGMB13025 TaxID=3039116 RepID=UPI00241EE9EF|nr:HypC/HybG/HupF family hydrogenase formation chaperone [Anaerocolumna sp. AGMB13025]WFR58107.1 HypC/HybG/HupF family hydrogenase formation chaperone [Anaerocolumna sp. AGMB13025]
MCVAVPGKIIEISGDIAKVDVLNNICEANVKLVDAKIGDYILIHAGFALEVMKQDMAEELISIFGELEEDGNEDPRTGKD